MMSSDQGPLSDYLCIILAAGLGKRLEPATLIFPKPALPLCGEPLCLGTLRLLSRMGAKTLHINTSHLGENLEACLSGAVSGHLTEQNHAQSAQADQPEHSDSREPNKHSAYDIAPIRYWRESPRLEVGGAIARIWQELLVEGLLPSHLKGVLIVSGDIVCDFPILEMIMEWEKQRSAAPATAALMVTRQDPGGRTDMTWVEGETNQIIGFGRTPPDTAIQPRSVLYASFKIMSPEMMPNRPEQVRFASAAELLYRPLVQSGARLIALPFREEAMWFNVGTPGEYDDAQKAIGKSPASAKALCRLPSQTQWSGAVIEFETEQNDQTELYSRNLENLEVEESLAAPVKVGSEELGYARFEEGVSRVLSLIKSQPIKKGPLGRGPHSNSRLIILIKLSKDFPVQLPGSVLVGGDLFVGLALSQRVSREASREWCSLLIVPASVG